MIAGLLPRIRNGDVTPPKRTPGVDRAVPQRYHLATNPRRMRRPDRRDVFVSPPAFTSMVGGRYTVLEELGRGAHAVVYRARDEQESRDVAIKLLRLDMADSKLAARFSREIRIASRLDHRGICRVLDSGEWEGRLYCVSELAVGATLSDRLKRDGQFPIAEALSVADVLAQALDHAHRSGIVHRDIKPANILFGRAGPLLTDFGVARALEPVVGWEQSVNTSTGVIVGTLLYMSPEQLCADQRIDGRSDQYSLALVVYEMLAGVRPHASGTIEGLRHLRMTGRQHAIRDHRPAVPPHIDAAVARALSPSPADRFPTCGAFGDALRDAQSAQPPVTVSARRRRWAVAAASGAVLVLLAARAGVWREAPASPWTAAELTVRLDAQDTLASRLADGIEAELGQWPGIQVIRGRSGAWRRLWNRGSSIAVHASAAATGDDSVVLTLGSETSGAAWRSNIHLPRSGLKDSDARLLAARVLGGPAAAADSAPRLETLPDRRREALEAYVSAWSLANAGRLDSAIARFRSAAAASPRFAGANLWSAQLMQWLERKQDEWAPYVDQALRDTAAMRTADVVAAHALDRIRHSDYDGACRLYGMATRADPASFVAQFGLGECQRLNDRVVVTAGVLRFQTSSRATVSAYTAALRIAPAGFGDLFDRAARFTFSAYTTPRVGRSGANIYYAVPGLTNDTISFAPIADATFRHSGRRSVPQSYSEAIGSARRDLLRFTGEWVARTPQSFVAHQWRALALEESGRIDESPGAETAPAAVRSALKLARTPIESVTIALAQTRLALRREDFIGAKRLADSLLAAWPVAPPPLAAVLARFAALRGDVSMAGTLLARSLEVDASGNRGLPHDFAQQYGLAYAAASLGACAQLPDLMRTARESLDRGFALAARDSIVAVYLTPIRRLAMPCLGASDSLDGQSPLIRAARAHSRGDNAGARAFLDSLPDLRRGVVAAAVSFDNVFAESWLRTQLGDSIGALSLLRSSLTSFADMSEASLDDVRVVGGLRQCLDIGATLAAARGDTVASARWRRALSTLGPTRL